MMIGQKEVFAFEIPEMPNPTAQFRECNIFIGGRSVCCDDNIIYTSAFIASLQSELRRLVKTYNFLKHEMLFYGKGVEDAHYLLRSVRSHEDALDSDLKKDKEMSVVVSNLGFMGWGPTTDNLLVFLLPVFGRIYLSYEFWRETHQPASEVGRVYAVEVTPYYLMKTIEAAIVFLNKDWVITKSYRT